MVYSTIPSLIPNLLIYIHDVELHHRTDGYFPLTRRMFELLLRLDVQPNLTVAPYTGVSTTVFYRTLEYYTIYYLYDGKDAVIIDADINDDSGKKYNLRDQQNILTGFDYSDIPSTYKVYRTSKYDYGAYIYVQNKKSKKYNLYDPINSRILLDLDYDEIIPYNQYDDGFYGQGFLIGDMGWYKLLPGGGHRYIDDKEKNESCRGCVNKSILEKHLRNIISEAVRQAMKETLNEKTLLEHRSIGRRRPNRVRNV